MDPESVFTFDDRALVVKLDGEQISNEELKQLKAEISALRNFRIWGIMQETVRQKAIEKAVLQSTDFEQVLAGKMMLLNLDIEAKIVDIIDKVQLQ